MMTREDATIQALMGHIDALEDTIKRQSETIKALEPKTGHWIHEDVLFSRCSECGKHAIIVNWSKVLSDYCPNCGAKMIEPQESEE